MHIMTLFSASRLITFLRSNVAVLIVGLMVVALPVATQSPQRVEAAALTGFSRVAAGDAFTRVESKLTELCGAGVAMTPIN